MIYLLLQPSRLDAKWKKHYCDESSMISQNLFEPEVEITVNEVQNIFV